MALHGRYSLLASSMLIILTLSTMAFAKNPSDHTSWGNNINIGPNEKVSDLTCFGCSIYVRGEVAGDVTAFAGSIVLEDHGEVAGDVTAFGGNIRLDPGVQVAGDVTLFGGEMRRDTQATISGGVTTMGGRGWIVPILLAPFVMLGLLVAFVIWLVQRARRPALPPVPA